MPLYRQAVGDWEAAHRLSLTLPKADVSAILPPASPKPAIGLYSSQHISSRPYQELFDYWGNSETSNKVPERSTYLL
jgi:hypothetical protein